jgi:hypothetical protein
MHAGTGSTRIRNTQLTAPAQRQIIARSADEEVHPKGFNE